MIGSNQLTAFCLLLPLGFLYVAGWLCGRVSPFASAVDPWGDWLAVALSGPAIYLVAGRQVLKVGARQSLRFVAYALLFIVGLHWQWIGHYSGAHFSLTAQHLAHLTRADGWMLCLGCTCGLALLAHCSLAARRAGQLTQWVAAILGVVALFISITLILGTGWRFHLHHYFWALSLAAFTRFQTRLCLLSQGFLIGVYVEGASRWGMGALWSEVPQP
jgi:hypothetical protein